MCEHEIPQIMSLEINGRNIRQSPVPNKKDKKSKSVVPTIRFQLSLTESNDNSCPEFSYRELHRDIIKKNKDKDVGMKDLAAIEEDKEKDEAEALAKYYEHKYGAPIGTGKKRKQDRIKDLVDVGYGYDENDPFVDDSEVYDEIVPSSLTTQHGGFYINMGKLEFKQLTDDEQGGSDSDDSLPLVHHKPQKRKKSSNPLSSDDSGEDTSLMLMKKKKKHLSKDGTKLRRKLSINGKESKLNHCTKSTMAKKLIAKAKAQQLMNSNNISGGFKNEERKLSHEKSVGKGKLESVIDKDLVVASKNITKNVMNIGQTLNQSDADKARKLNDNESTNECKELPPNLPDQLTTNIKTLTQIAKTSEGEGKMKFFSSNVNNILLDIESNSLQLSNRVRNGMYQHLAHHLPCSKDTLMKRAKKLHAGVQDEIMKQPLIKLKEAIEVEMEDQLKHYQQEVMDHQAKLAVEGQTAEKMLAASASTDEDDEESKNKPDAGGNDKKRKASGPRKKFKWSENIRSLLVEVVKVKIKQFESTKLRGTQSYEELLKTFLDTTVKPLWPKPWMQTRFLIRESRSAHEHLTQAVNANKPKKAGNVNKKSIPVAKPDKKPQSQVNANSFADLIRQSIIGDTSKAELDIKNAIHAQVITSNNTQAPSGDGKRRIDMTKTVISKVIEPVKIIPDGKSNKIHCDTAEVKTKTISVTPRLKLEEPKPKQPVMNTSMNKMPQLNSKALSDFSSGMSDEWFMQLLKNQQMHSPSTADSSIFQSLYPIKMTTQPKQMSKPSQVKTMSKNFHLASPESSQAQKRTEKSPQGAIDRIIKTIPIIEKKSNTFKPVSSSPIMNNPLRHLNYSSPPFINNWEPKLQQPKVISSSSSIKSGTKNFAGSSLMNKHSNISQSSSQSPRNVVNKSPQLALRNPVMNSSLDEFRASVTKPSTAAYGTMLTTPKHSSQKPGHSLPHKQTHSLYQSKTTPEKNQTIPIHSLHAPTFPPNHSLFSPSLQYIPQVPHQKELLNSLSVQSQLHNASTNPNSFGILPPNMQYTSGLMPQFPQVYLHDIAEQMRTSSSQSENGKR